MNILILVLLSLFDPNAGLSLPERYDNPAFTARPLILFDPLQEYTPAKKHKVKHKIPKRKHI